MTLNHNNNNSNSNNSGSGSSGGHGVPHHQQPASKSPSRDEAARRSALPTAVTHIPDELLKSFPHTKRVGNYLLGRTIGEGSFAKVKEGLQVVTGEQVFCHSDLFMHTYLCVIDYVSIALNTHA